MAEIQFEVITDLAVMNPQHIETNFEAVRDYLAEMMAPYTSIVVEESAISEAKKKLAALRKLKDGINSQKIAVKKEWMKPYTEYEDKAKELMALVESGISNIDSQVKEYDARRKEQKMAELEEYFRSKAEECGVSEFVSWETTKDPKWANASISMDVAQGQINVQLSMVTGDLDYIRSANSPFETAMLDEYRKSRDLRAALAVEKRLVALQEAEERRKAERVAETFREEQEDSDGFPANPAPIQMPQPQFIRRMDEEEPPKPKTYTLDFRVVVTMRQANALKQFFTDQGIEYHKL